MSSKYLLECCVDSVESAIHAEEGGADRLELCANLVIGGTTPTTALFHAVRKAVAIKIHVLVRPRFGDFLYSACEAEIICDEIRTLRDAGADGIVVGSLLPDGSLNLEQLKRFLDCAGTLPVTLHRAFDMCRDPFCALEQAKVLGIRTVLTSGQAPSCAASPSRMKQLCHAAGNDITILAGAGITEEAVRLLLRETPLTAFHMSGKKIISSGMTYRNPQVSMGLPGMSEYDIWQTDATQVRAVRRLLDEAGLLQRAFPDGVRPVSS